MSCVYGQGEQSIVDRAIDEEYRQRIRYLFFKFRWRGERWNRQRVPTMLRGGRNQSYI